MSFKFTQSKKYKLFMNYVYGWGASAVIIGALFKIMHFPGATYVLTAGMLVEAFIFFLSAFEPQMEHYEWSNVFPELSKDFKGDKTNFSNNGGSMSLDVVDDETKKKIKDGLSKLAASVENVKDISESAVATSAYKDSIISAAAAMTQVSKESSEASSKIAGFKAAIEMSSEELKKASTSVGNYAVFVESFQDDFKSNVNAFNTNISALNTIYEIQLKNTNEYISSFNNVQEGVNDIASNLSNTVESTKLYKEESEKLGRNISNLNNVYGNMLSVFNNPKNK